MTSPSEPAGSRKRTVDKITPEIVVDDDDETTHMLHELYELRKKKTAEKENSIDAARVENDNKIVTLKDFQSNGKLEKDGELEQKKNQNTNKSERKWLYLSNLLFYTKDQVRDCMITFNQMMHEDLCKDSADSEWTLEAAFMTTYGYELELLEPLLKANVRVVLANDLTLGSGLKLVEQSFRGYPNLTLIHPPKVNDHGLEGAFHPKLWLLKFPSTLRVVVATGNLYVGAWSIWSNCLWFQDFPLKKGQEENKKDSSAAGFDFDKDFKETLESFVQAIMPSKMDYKSILKFDLNDYVYENIDVILIPSVMGRYRGPSMNKYGIGKIKYVLEKLPCQVNRKPNRKIITYQTSSIGQADEKYIEEFTASVLPGYKTLKELGVERSNAKKFGKDTKQLTLFSKNKPDSFSAVDRMRLIFPTEKYVEDSVIGAEAVGCLFLKKDFYESGRLPKKIFHQFEAPGIIPHLKVFIITNDDTTINDDTIIYFGSHNFSPAAWGKYERDFTQIAINNSELGVLIPPMKGSAERKRDLVENLSFKYPPKKYSSTDEPFFPKNYV